MPNLAALRAAIFKLFAKNRWGQNLPPVRVLVRVLTQERNTVQRNLNLHDDNFRYIPHAVCITIICTLSAMWP